MCGGELTLSEGVFSGNCEYCGCLVMLPGFSSEQEEQRYAEIKAARNIEQMNQLRASVPEWLQLLNAHRVLELSWHGKSAQALALREQMKAEKMILKPNANLAQSLAIREKTEKLCQTIGDLKTRRELYARYQAEESRKNVKYTLITLGVVAAVISVIIISKHMLGVKLFYFF